MTISKYRGWGVAIGVCAGLLSACASTTMESVQRAPGFQTSQIRKVLVVGIAQTPGLRELFEDEFVRQWKKRGITAVASSKILPADVTLDKAGVEPIAKAQGFDSVLVTRVLKRQAIKAEVANAPSQYPAGAPPEDEPNLTHYIQAIVASPEYGKESGIEYEVAVLSTNLYNVATEQRIWAGVTQTLVTGDIPKLVGPFIKLSFSRRCIRRAKL